MIPEEKLDLWITKNRNVLLEGEKGVGKSSIIIESFSRNRLRMKYFSAATMDPWIDFIGIPSSSDNSDGRKTLEFIRDIGLEDYDVFVFDEFNRAHKKIRNAVMELIQFQSINGNKFKNLRMIWAAINPDDSDYDVEPLDPAQKDRFHIWYKIDYKVYPPYFIKKFGKSIAETSIEWWNNLKLPERKEVSPRRLDYAIEWYQQNGDIRDVIPSSLAPVSNLISGLKKCSLKDQLISAREMWKGNKEAFSKFLNDDKNFSKFETTIRELKDSYIVSCLNPEHLQTYKSLNG